MKPKPFVHAVLAAALLILSPLSLALDHVNIQLRWKHQFQFAGYYMAREKGFYQAAGLDVELIPGGPQALRPIEDVLSGKVDFAVTGSGVVIDRMNGKPVVALAAIMQTSPIVWITLKSANIRTPHDLAGHKVLIMPPPESAELLTMLEREGLSKDNIDIQPTSFNIDDLINGKADAYDGYISNEPYYLEQQGIEYSIINPRDYGINFYSDVLITSERLSDSDPDLVNRVKEATLKGWEYALNHIDESVQLIHRQYAPGKTLDHLRFEANTIKRLVMPELVQIGHMNPGRWQFIAESYRQLNMTSSQANLDGFLFREDRSPNYLLAIKVGGFSAALLLIAALIIFKFRKMSMQLADSNRLLSQQAVTDQLTQVRNRRGLEEQAGKILSLAGRKKMPCSFLMLDIDHFKAINDHYGHQAGDAALIAFAETIATHRRHHDVIARVGGEEFAILLVDTPISDARLVAERILADVRQMVIDSPNTPATFSLTASIGIAPATGTLEEFWLEADKALYQAKDAGRDCVVTAHSPA